MHICTYTLHKPFQEWNILFILRRSKVKVVHLIVHQTRAHLGKYVHYAQGAHCTPARKHGDDAMCCKFPPQQVTQDVRTLLTTFQLTKWHSHWYRCEKWNSQFRNVGNVAPAVAVPGATWAACAALCQQLSIEINDHQWKSRTVKNN